MAGRSTEVVVVGGGIIGCATAYHLARRSIRCVLFEREDIAAQQSGRNWGFVRQQGRHPFEVPLMVEANRMWRGLERELETDMEWVQGGNLALAADRARLELFERWLPTARESGLETRLLTSREIGALLPGMARTWAGGLYTPSDGHAEPAKATNAFRRAATRLGAEIVTGCAVEEVVVTNGRVSGVVTEGEEVATSCVVCAAGAWSARIARRLGLALPQRLVRATVARAAPVAPVTRAGVWAPALAFRQRLDGSLNLAAGGVTDYDITLDSLRHLRLFLPNYLHNRKLFRFHLGWPLLRDLRALAPWSAARCRPFSHDRGVETPPNPRKVQTSLREFELMFPAVGPLRLERAWAGYIDVTPDVLPVIGEVASPGGLIFATGFSGHGFAMGPIVGRLVSELVADGKASLDLRRFRFLRFAEGDPGGPHSVL